MKDYNNVKVAVCLDGQETMTINQALETVRVALTLIFRVLGIEAIVKPQQFSFLSNDSHSQKECLQNADVFWFGGVYRRSKQFNDTIKPESTHNRVTWPCDTTIFHNLAAEVRNQVQLDRLLYVGICGGATMAGAAQTSGYLGPMVVSSSFLSLCFFLARTRHQLRLPG